MNDMNAQTPASSTSSSAGGNSVAPEQHHRKPRLMDIYYPRKITGHQDMIYIASFPPIVFFWPTLIILFLCAFLQGVGVSPSFLGWTAIIIFSLNVLVLVQDFDQKKFLILILALVALFLGVWILNLYGFSFLKTFAAWILSFKPEMSTDTYLLQGILLFGLYVWGLIVPMFDYWKFEQNEFIHYTQPIGKDMSIARLGCTVYKEIPDVFETLLTFGGGNLVIRRDNQNIAVIHNVPFLGLRMNAIEHMLSETRVVVDKSI